MFEVHKEDLPRANIELVKSTGAGKAMMEVLDRIKSVIASFETAFAGIMARSLEFYGVIVRYTGSARIRTKIEGIGVMT